MTQLTGSVGVGGENAPEDVTIVQKLLAAQGYDLGEIDGLCGPRTIRAIRAFQATILTNPDGLIEVNQKSWARLSAPTERWRGDSSKWNQEQKLLSLHPALRPKVQAVLAELTAQGFQPKIFYGWRSVAVQLRLVAEGHSTVRFSFHNAQLPDGTPDAYAVDIIDKRYGWEAEAEASGFWQALGQAARQQGLFWGGDWSGFRDWAHLQLLDNSALARIKQQSGLA
ncbi:MAG: M15 family metallopeptidase [Magnetococcales bacterium]|nr:M15 family metallopeptidase [Magnetococcales bacterium]